MPSSQLMMPLAFAAHAGSMLALTGSPVNVLCLGGGRNAGAGEFGFFEFTIVGVPLLLGTIAIVVLVGGRLLPHAVAALHAAGLQRAAPGSSPLRARRRRRRRRCSAGTPASPRSSSRRAPG